MGLGEIFFLFLFGLAVGSFLNVLIDRWPSGKSVIYGRSFCDHCRRKLFWYDLIPVVSFFLLQGKCRFCRKKISWQYPLVELLTGFLFIGTAFLLRGESLTESFCWRLFYHLIVVSLLLVIFFTDLKYRIIPDEANLILLAVSFAFYLSSVSLLWQHILAGVMLFSFFLFLALLTRGKGMGLGDVKMAGVMGLILGFPRILVAFYLAFLTGALVSLILIIGGKKKWKSQIPFGPFLSLATFLSLFWGEKLFTLGKNFLGL